MDRRRSPRALVLGALLTPACASAPTPPPPTSAPEAPRLEWAINVGGPAYTATDGTRYAAEHGVQGGEVRALETVKGSQDRLLYETYRVGDVTVAHALPNGTYDVTFHFAEPEDIKGGTRVFDAFVEDTRVVDDLDVMASRDGKVYSALTVTVPDVEVEDGELNVRFEASAMQPVLSALVVRAPHARDEAWSLVWQEDFDGPELDRDRWAVQVWPARKVNDEDQAYTDRPQNLRIEDGHLVIEAHKEDYEGAKYTSGRIYSKPSLLYGRVEVRARLPRGKGTWPAIWMLPDKPFTYATKCDESTGWQGNSACDAWPNSGEIDIMEHVGYQMGHVHGTVHNKAYYWENWEQRKGRVLLDDVERAFHIYSVEWSPERVDVFVDDTLYFTYVNEHTDYKAWPYDHAFQVILNVAVGGAWGRAGGGIDDSIFPQRMLVDFVRVYSRE